MSYTIQADGRYHIPIVDLGNRLQDNFGLRVREHSAFGGVTGGHSPNSYHKYDEALDVTDWRPDVIDGVDWRTRTGNLQNILKGSGAEIIGPNSGDPDHSTHLHLAARDGLFKLTQEQYDTLFGGNAGGKSATFAQLTEGPTAVEPSQPGDKPKADAKERATKFITRNKTAGEAVEGFGNEFAKMESKRLGDALAGAQESIIQKRMDAGENFGTVTEQETLKEDKKDG